MSLHRRRANQQKEDGAASSEVLDSQGKNRGEPRRVEAKGVLRNAAFRYVITVALAAAFWTAMQLLFRHAGHGLQSSPQ